MIHNKKTIIVLGTSVAIFVLLVCLYVFFFVTMREKNAHALDAVTRANALEGKEQNISQNGVMLKTHAADINKLNSLTIKESGAIGFAQQLENLGKVSNTNLSLESLEPISPTKDTQALAFRIKASGTFENLTRLLGLVENFPTKSELLSVALFRGDEVSKDGVRTWTLTISGNVLSYSKE